MRATSSDSGTATRSSLSLSLSARTRTAHSLIFPPPCPHVNSFHSGLLGLPVDFQRARALYRRAAQPTVTAPPQTPHATAINNLGVMANAGQGQPANGREAARFFLHAARGGHVMAMCNLAHILAEGRAEAAAAAGSVESDDDEDDDDGEAQDPEHTSDGAYVAALGSPPASRHLVRMLASPSSSSSSSSVRRNAAAALHWFDRAAHCGHEQARAEAARLVAAEVPRLVFLHRRGTARPRHYALLGACCLRLAPPAPHAAAFFWERAAAAGHVPALRQLGMDGAVAMIRLYWHAL
jgi:TPR repeat protein